MPANLPPQFFDVEKNSKRPNQRMKKSPSWKSCSLSFPSIKGQKRLQALYKTKIAKLKSQAQKKTGISRRGQPVPYRKSRSRTGRSDRPPKFREIIPGKSPDQCRTRGGRLSVHNPYSFTCHDEIREYPDPIDRYSSHHSRNILNHWQAEMIKNADLAFWSIRPRRKSRSREDYLRALQEKLQEKKIFLVPSGQARPESIYGFFGSEHSSWK